MRNAIGRIVACIVLMLFCHNNGAFAAVPMAVVGVDTLIPFKAESGEDWVMMPKSRLVRIAERVDSLTIVGQLYTNTEGAYFECRKAMSTMETELALMQRDMKLCNQIGRYKDSIIADLTMQRDTLLSIRGQTEKKDGKRIKRLRSWLTVAGIAIVAMLSAVVAFAVK